MCLWSWVHVHFPTHKDNHTLDLVITSSDSSLSPKPLLSLRPASPHPITFPFLQNCLSAPSPCPHKSHFSPPSLHRIDANSFLSDLQSSSLVSNPPQSLDSLLPAYNSTLSSLLDKHAHVITKPSYRCSKSNPWFTSALYVLRSCVRRAENIWKRTRSALDWSSFTSLRNLSLIHISEPTRPY